ncbi:extracellular solute-binding protein, partial [Paenibacillus sp. 1001270B_150601_E10]|uniref:extracellular solute-binding protein n=1 Tax=Paenibacillus sp. 1001270B_150601_E10 TaxID=2787079 RepID=UPI00189D5B99
WDIGTAFERKDPILQQLEKQFNLTIQPVNITSSDYMQKLQMWATSDKLPDVFAHSIASDSPGIYNEWMKHRLIKPLPEDLTPYPYVDQIAQIPDIRLLKKDNKLYMLPRIGYPTNRLWMLERVLFVRKDWMNDLLLHDIASYEQFSNMLAAFKNRTSKSKPSQMVGLTASGMNMLSWAFSSTFPQFATEQWVFEHNQWIPFYASKKMDKVVVQLRELYRNGTLDPEFYYIKEEDAVLKFVNGQAGALVYRATPDSLSELEERWKAAHPDKSFYDAVDILHVWPTEDGHRYFYAAQTYWSETFFNAKISDEKMDRILRLYDYLLSPEGQMLTSYGMEGKDYKVEDGSIIITRPYDEQRRKLVDLDKTYPSIAILRSLASWGKDRNFRFDQTNRIKFGDHNIEKSLDEMEWQFNHATATPTYPKINSLSTPAKDKLGTLINPLEDLIKVTISSEDPVAMWHRMVERYESLGLNKAITEVNTALQQRQKQ